MNKSRRINELARDLEVKSHAILDKLKELGIIRKNAFQLGGRRRGREVEGDLRRRRGQPRRAQSTSWNRAIRTATVSLVRPIAMSAVFRTRNRPPLVRDRELRCRARRSTAPERRLRPRSRRSRRGGTALLSRHHNAAAEPASAARKRKSPPRALGFVRRCRSAAVSSSAAGCRRSGRARPRLFQLPWSASACPAVAPACTRPPTPSSRRDGPFLRPPRPIPTGPRPGQILTGPRQPLPRRMRRRSNSLRPVRLDSKARATTGPLASCRTRPGCALPRRFTRPVARRTRCAHRARYSRCAARRARQAPPARRQLGPGAQQPAGPVRPRGPVWSGSLRSARLFRRGRIWRRSLTAPRVPNPAFAAPPPSPRPGAPVRPPASPTPGRPIYQGPARPGAPMTARGPARPGGPRRAAPGRTLASRACTPLRALPAAWWVPAPRRRSPDQQRRPGGYNNRPGGRPQGRRREGDDAEKVLRPRAAKRPPGRRPSTATSRSLKASR